MYDSETGICDLNLEIFYRVITLRGKKFNKIMVCFRFKQNGTLSESDTEKMDTPTIVVKESELFSVVEEADIWIYVDGEKYIKVPNMYEAILSVFAAYYIFNITYDKSLKSLFEFFDYLCDNRQSTYTKTSLFSCSKK